MKIQERQSLALVTRSGRRTSTAPTAASAILLTFLLTGTVFWGGLDLSTRVHSSPVD